MNRVDRLIKQYKRFAELPWDQGLAGPQRVWFIVYDKADERRIRARLEVFKQATEAAHHAWLCHDLTDAFGTWMARQEYRESYFKDPSVIDLLLPEFEAVVVGQIEAVLTSPGATENTVVAVLGTACLYGFARVSSVVKAVVQDIRGRLLVFFPGVHEGNNYRLLDARDGWNYMAIALTAEEE